MNIIKKLFKKKKKNIKRQTSSLDTKFVDEKDRKQLRQFSKKLIIVIMILCGFWITWSYVLATLSLVRFSDCQPLEELSKQIIITVLGCSLGYFCKSFFETYSEKKNDLEYYKFDNETDNNICNDESVG